MQLVDTSQIVFGVLALVHNRRRSQQWEMMGISPVLFLVLYTVQIAGEGFYKISMTSLNCSYVQCLAPKPLCYNGKCYHTCPDNLVVNNSICISSDVCSSAGWVMFNTECLKDCPFAYRNITLQEVFICRSNTVPLCLMAFFTVCLGLVSFACFRFFKGPKKVETQKEEEQQLQDNDDDQTLLLSNEAYVFIPELYHRSPHMHNDDTSLKRTMGGAEGIQERDTSLKEVDLCRAVHEADTYVKEAVDWSLPTHTSETVLEESDGWLQSMQGIDQSKREQSDWSQTVHNSDPSMHDEDSILKKMIGRNQPMHGENTVLKEVIVSNQPIIEEDTMLKEVIDRNQSIHEDETFLKEMFDRSQLLLEDDTSLKQVVDRNQPMHKDEILLKDIVERHQPMHEENTFLKDTADE